MKSKFILPLLAVVFAVAGALAAPMLAQIGWYDSNGSSAGGGMQGTITTPPGDTPVCSVSATNQICKIRVGLVDHNAFNTKENAESANQAGLLRYD
ncbi:MAG: hypothetical protein HWD62_07295 [Cyclobacteriaceae bacterium]|nr:MAG: hypothetical protein HWD62_07295 [Cyclobacteriaceae bacterium]